MSSLLLAAVLVLWPGRRRGVRTAAGPSVGWSRSPGSGVAAALTAAGSPGRALLGLAGACVVAPAALLAGPAGLLACAAVLVTGTVLVRQALADRRRRAALADIGAGMRLLGRELRAGADPVAAAGTAGSAARGDAALVLGELSRLTRSEGPAEPALEVFIDDERPAAQAVARLRSGWLLTRRHGVAFTPLIESLADDLAQQLSAEHERAGQVAGPRMSGYVMAVLPGLGLALGAGMGADPVGVLLGSAAGHVLLLVGVALTCAGLLWSARIVGR